MCGYKIDEFANVRRIGAKPDWDKMPIYGIPVKMERSALGI